MLPKPPNSPCSTCFMVDQRLCAGFSTVEGTGAIPLLFVAEALGEHELREGLPLRPQAPAGSVFERALRELGYDRSSFSITNVLRGQPRYNKLAGTDYEHRAIRQCLPYLEQTIAETKPKVIVALGDIAFRTLTGMTGKDFKPFKVRGYFVWSERYNCYVLGTFHPSFILRGENQHFPVFKADIRKAIDAANSSNSALVIPGRGNYRVVRSAAELDELVREVKGDQSRLIAFDIETGRHSLGVEEDKLLSIMRSDDDFRNVLPAAAGEILEDGAESAEDASSNNGDGSADLDAIFRAYEHSQIESVQFSLAPGTGWFIPYRREFLEGIREILASPNPKAAHNGWIFDQPILERNGFVINGTHDDTLWMWHHTQPDSPASLQWVASFYGMWGPWKQMAAGEPEVYGCADVDAVQRIMAQLPSDLKSMGLWDSYVKFVRDFHPILRDMQNRGMKIDLDKRDAFQKQEETIVAEFEQRIQELIPPELHKYKDYTIWPEVLRPLRAEYLAKANIGIAKKKDHLTKFAQIPTELQQELINRAAVEFPTFQWKEFADEIRPCIPIPFNPRSSQQLKDYIRVMAVRNPKGGYSIPKSLEGKETTAKKELERLARRTGDVVLGSILELRRHQKVITTYIKGWKVAADSAVHTTFTFAPATWQLSSRGPNIQNCFPGSVEILTDRGWIEFANLVDDDLVAQYELNGNISFVRPVDKIKQFYQGDLVTISTDEQIDITMTPDHECLLQHRKTGVWKKVPAHSYPEDYRQYHAGWYVGAEQSTLTKDQLVVCAALQADGTITKEGALSWRFGKDRKIERLSNTLIRLNIPYRVYNHRTKGHTEIYIWRDDIPEWLTDKKFFGPWILKLAREEFEFLAKEIYFWDGCYSRQSMYSSSIRSNADWAQILALLTGQRAKIREYSNDNPNAVVNYQTDVSLRPYSLTTNRTVKTVPNSNGTFVYCVTVPAGNIIVRQNGKALITGNCPKHGALAKEFRRCIVPSSGRMIIEADYKSAHALTLGFCAGDTDYMRLARLDCHSFVAAHLLHLPEAVSGKLIEMSDEEMLEYFAWFKSDPQRKFVRDKKAKPCLAEGSLVLTNNGLKPIETVTTDDLVWDGVEWVSHDGVICLGIKEVIEYETIVATPDHEVVTHDGRIVPLFYAKDKAIPLDRTELQGSAIRTSNRDLLERSARERLSVFRSSMPDLSVVGVGEHGEFDEGSFEWVRPLCAGGETTDADTTQIGQALRCDCATLQQSERSELHSLRRAGNSVQVPDAQGIHSVGREASTTSNVFEGGIGSGEQRRTLRTGEPTADYAQGADGKSTNYGEGIMERRVDPPIGMDGMPLRTVLGNEISEEGHDRRGDCCAVPAEYSRTQWPKKVAKVYDIVNAGPRRCYTVSGHLVLNCILGYGFGLGKKKLYDMNIESFSSQAEAGKLIELLDSLFPRTAAFRLDIRKKAHQQKFLISPWGAIRWFQSVFVRNTKYNRLDSGRDSEAAIAFLPANAAFGKVREAMIDLRKEGLDRKYGLNNTVHDSLVFDCPNEYVDEAVHTVKAIMERPASVLTHPTICPDGLVIGVEVSVGDDWASLKEIHI